MEKKMITIQNSDGTKLDVELVTYIVSDDHQTSYVVYSKGEVSQPNMDEVIYISRFTKGENGLLIEEIKDDVEWRNVVSLLKRIANA